VQRKDNRAQEKVKEGDGFNVILLVYCILADFMKNRQTFLSFMISFAIETIV
jgi:hypothetical protein